MMSAIGCAESSCAKGNHPFGAVLFFNDEIVLSAENTVVTDRDCTAHAEINLVRLASAKLSAEERRKSILYASTEPCAMCAGAIYWSGIRSVVFGCSVQEMARFTSGSFVTQCREVFARGIELTTVIGPFCEERAVVLHSHFWRKFRF